MIPHHFFVFFPSSSFPLTPEIRVQILISIFGSEIIHTYILVPVGEKELQDCSYQRF